MHFTGLLKTTLLFQLIGLNRAAGLNTLCFEIWSQSHIRASSQSALTIIEDDKSLMNNELAAIQRNAVSCRLDLKDRITCLILNPD